MGLFDLPSAKSKKKSSGLGSVISDVAHTVGDVASDVVDAVGNAADEVASAATQAASTAYDAAEPVAAGEAAQVHREAVKAKRAATRQKRLVNRYVTKAYSRRLQREGVPTLQVRKRVENAKSDLAKERDRLLSNPSVQEANADGKVVRPKGLQTIRQRERQYQALKGPSGLKTTEAQGTFPRSLTVGKPGLEKLARIEGVPQGQVGRTQAIAQDAAHLRGEPSTFETLQIASIGIPGLGIGADAVKLAQLGARAIPALASKEGAAQLASRVGARAAEKAAATKALPRTIPAAIRSAPSAGRAAVRELPSAARGAPAALGRGAVKGGQKTAYAGSGLATVAATQNAGIDTSPGRAADAILKGAEGAITENPKGTAFTTLRALPAAITAPAALAYTAGQIPFEGTGPFEETAKSQLEGLKEIGANLLSGDPERTQQAFEKEGAFTLLTPLPAVTRSRVYKAAREDVRGAAAAVRRKSGKGRIAPKDVEQNLFGWTERRESRGRIAKMHSRTSNPRRISEARHTNAILHGTTRRPALSSAPEGSHVALQTLLEYGIRDSKGVELVRKQGPQTEPHVEGKVNLDAALKYAEENPNIFRGKTKEEKAFLRALAAGEKASKANPASMVGAGEVARLRGQGDLFGILPPDKGVPFKAREFTDATTREGAWKQLASFEGRIKKATGKRKRDLDKRAKSLRKALDPYTRPDAKSLTSDKRRAWDKELAKEYYDKVEAAVEKSPLVPGAWTHHSTFRGSKMGIEGSALPGTADGKQYVRKGTLSEHDMVDRSLEAFVRGTVQMPRRRAAAADFGREFVRNEKLPFTLNGKAQNIVPDSETWAKITGPKTKDNPDGGQYDPKTYARFPLRQWKSAVRDPFTTEGDLKAILSDAEARKIRNHEPSIIVKRESVKEFAEAVNPDPGTVTEAANKLSRTSSRLILGTNPAWVIAQIPAEGIPLALAHPELLNPAKSGNILKQLAEYRKTHPEESAMLEGSAGASPQITAGTLKTPLDLEKESAYNPQPAMFADGAKALTRSRFGRAMRSTARLEPLGLFDVKRQNAYRSLLLAAEADKRYRSWTSSVQKMYRKSANISENFRGKPREEMWTWLTTTKKGKAELQKLSDYVDNIQGNWTAFSRYERAFAPLTIFYPFLRYSLRWTLWTFPKTHPLTATIAYMLGQANSNELEKLLGAKPASPIQYAFPVVKDGEGESNVLPGGSRIAPGQSVVQQAVAGESASQLAGGLNPFLGAGLTAIGGPGPFGQQPSNDHGWAAIDQLLSLPAPLRITDITSEKVASAFGLASPEPESVISKAFKKLDPDKSKRSLLFPPLPQSGKNAQLSNKLSLALKQASENSKEKQSDVAGDDSLTVQDRQKKIAAMRKRSDESTKAIDSVLKELDLTPEDTEAYERWKESLYGGEEDKKESIYSTQAPVESIYSTPGDSKALQYKPPNTGFSLPGLPNVDLGAITNPLAALVGGEKAQAAERPKKSRPKVPKIEGITHGDEAKEFAQYLAKYTGLDPQFVGAWVQSEGGGFAAGGEAGKNNWLGVGYPGEQTSFSQSPYFNGSAKKAAKATADWIEGKIGGEYDYAAADSIKSIIPLAAGKGPEAALAALEQSGWGTSVDAVRQNLGMISAKGKVAAAPALKKEGGPFGGSRRIVRQIVGTKVRGDKELGHSSGGDHQPVSAGGSPLAYAQDINGDNPQEHEPPYTQGTLNKITKNLRKLGADVPKMTLGDPSTGNWEGTVKGYRVQLLTNEGGEVSHIHVGARWEGEEAPPGTYAGGGAVSSGSSIPGMPVSTGSAVPGMSIGLTSPTIKRNESIPMSTPAERLQLVNEISSGNLEGLGVPSSEATGPSLSRLTAAARELEEERRKLLRL